MRIDRRGILARGLVLALVGLLAGCAEGADDDGTVTLGAAASLRRVLPELIEAYGTIDPDARFDVTYASSGTLRSQVDAGAPLDGVLLASERMADQLIRSQRAVADSRTVVASNVLVLIAARDSPATTIAALPALPDEARLAIGAPASAPVGRYARDLLRARGLWDDLQEHLVYARDVRAVVAYVRRGEAAAGFAYATDARTAPDLVVLEVADGTQDPTPRIVGVAIADAPQAAGVQTFLAWLTSPEAQAVLAAHGFGAP